MKNIFKTSDLFILSASIFSMVISIFYWFTGFQEAGQFIGLWVPSILGFGIYIKLLSNNRTE